MKWIEVKVIFDFNDKQLATDLISNVFYDLGLQGVLVEEPGIDPPEGWGKDAIKPEHFAVIGYFPKNEKFEERLQILKESLASLLKENGIICRVVYSDINEMDWAESWKAYFWPEKISANIVVKPVWREYSKCKNEIVLEIDPGMAFGTGLHPTTSLCVSMIEKYLKRKDSFLDVGTGSGIMMIAAAKLGAGKVWGTDNDKVASNVARNNLMQNRIEKSMFKVITCNLVDKVEERFDLVAANITLDAILTLFDDVKKVMTDNGIFISSGIIEENKDKVIYKMKNNGFELIEILTKENWVSIVCKQQ
jgi:ribosomal protein L11 methyltransferase